MVMRIIIPVITKIKLMKNLIYYKKTVNWKIVVFIEEIYMKYIYSLNRTYKCISVICKYSYVKTEKKQGFKEYIKCSEASE